MNMKSAVLLLVLFSSLHAGSQALSHRVYELRDPKTQPAQFRQALESIGEYLALEILEELDTQEASIETLTGQEAKHTLANETPVLITILRGGMPLIGGAHKVFPQAEVGFLAMSRNEETLKAEVDYIAIPSIQNRTVILTDTMLATGGSLLDAIRIIEPHQPKRIFVLAAIAAQPGIDRLYAYRPDIKIFAATIDPALNDKGYIIPGLGDAGDRCYGPKSIMTAH